MTPRAKPPREVPEAFLRMWFPNWKKLPREQRTALLRAANAMRALFLATQATGNALDHATPPPGWAPWRVPVVGELTSKEYVPSPRLRDEAAVGVGAEESRRD